MDPAPPDLNSLLDVLLRKTARGDRAAFARLYELSSAKLFGVALRILRQRDMAEDVLQEAFIAIWQRAADFDPAKGSAMTWLNTVVRHRAIDAVRRLGHRADRPGDFEAELGRLEAGAAASADRQAGLRALMACLAELEAAPRRAVLLAYLYGFTHEELAQRLAVPLGTIKSWTRRSLERLKRCLDG
jgi:RNA polymerase sigma-70 factor (ECF subfamily)